MFVLEVGKPRHMGRRTERSSRSKGASITRGGIDRVTDFIGALESIPPDQISDFHCFTKPDGTFVLALQPNYHPTICALMKALGENNFVQPFNWVKWKPTARRIFNQPERLSAIRLGTCIKLITLHVRQDRFCGGHFGEMVRSGHVVGILRRLAALKKNVSP